MRGFLRLETDVMAKIRDDNKQAILERTDIVDLIGEYLRLQQAGSRFKALCPFHKEKTPSFVVSPERQMFHCFGCGAGGDAIKFVQMQENLDFVGALEFLGRRVGIHVEWSGEDKVSGTAVEARLLQEALEFFHQRLKKGDNPRVQELLKRRGLTQEAVNLFQIGYADPQWNSLIEHFQRKKVPPQQLTDAGLATSGSGGKGNVVDWFRDRLIFPIFSVSGQVVGFGGRSLGDEHPKYLNSPEKGKFKKGRLLYALNLARKAMMEKKAALLAEGYMDVVALHRHGFTHGVGSLGTALTLEQVQLLKRYVERCYLVYDGDSAGKKAALRAIDLFRDADLPCRVVTLPEGTDPDDFLSQRGAREFQLLLDQAPEAFDYRLEAVTKQHDLKSVEGRQAAARNMGAWIVASPSAVARSGYWAKLADCLNLPQQVLIEEMESVRRTRRKTRIQEKEEEDAAPKGLSKPSQAQLAKQGLLALVFEAPEFAPPAVEFWNGLKRDLQDEDDPVDPLLDRLAAWCAERQAFRPEPFREKMEKEGFSEVLARVLVGEPVPANRKKAFDEYCQTIRYHLVQQRIARQLKQLREQEEGGADSKFSREWTRQAYQLEQERYGLGVNR